MSDSLPFLPWAHTVVDGPEDVGSEQRWHVKAQDGRNLVVAQLAPDLAADVSIRRRWVRDSERIRDMGVHALVPVLELGPQPDPRATDAPPPWRVRLDPPGQPLSRWLARAPITVEELTQVFSAVADALSAVHAKGAVLRDLRPEQILVAPDGRVLLADVGLSRVDILSSHTASSLLLQGSSYAAPEQVTTTAVDSRSDLFSLGVMMWEALMGARPFGDGPAFLRQQTDLPDIRRLRGDVPNNVALVVMACLQIDPSRRPNTAMDVAFVLRGGGATSLVEHAMTTCQHCGAKLRVGQRLCISCGRVSVKFTAAQPGAPAFGLDLVSLEEDATKLKWLQSTLRDVSQGPIKNPEFIVGSVHLYSDEEKIARIRLPVRLYNGLSQETAEQLNAMMREHGLNTALVGEGDLSRLSRMGVALTLGVLVTAAVGFALGGAIAGGVLLGLTVVVLIVSANRYTNRKLWIEKQRAEFMLRPLPAALPASDPLVARVAGLLEPDMADDVRAVVADLALLVQRLVDHRAHFVRDTREIDMLTAPLLPLIGSVEARVAELARLGAELKALDEGTMVRALAASEARGEGPDQRQPILDGLDRLRALEDQRAAVFQRLLEAQSLLSRTIELGLAQHDDGTEHDRQVALAVATLTG